MDIEEFKKTVMPLREKLQRFARSMLGNEADAEDVVQEAMIRMWNARLQIAEHPNVDALAIQIVKNISIDKLRQKKFTLEVGELQIASDSKNPYILTEESDKVSIVRKIIETLPDIQKSILLMRDVEGYEFAEIADITGVSEETIRVTLSRARKKVRDRFMNIDKLTTEITI